MTFFTASIMISFALLTGAVLIGLIRVVIGPTLRDRAVALGTISTIAIGSIAVFAIESEQELLLDTVIVWAVLSFIGTVAFGLFLERRAARNE